MSDNQSNSTINNSNQSVADHECVSLPCLKDRFNYCITCHVFMPKDDVSRQTIKKFYRTEEYNQPDNTCVNPNTILENLIKNQSVNRYYNLTLKNLHYRAEMIQWIKKICKYFDFGQHSYHLSVAVFDAILSLYQMPEEQIRLVAFLSIYLSGKHLENDEKIPTLKIIVQFFNKEFSREDFMNYELFVIQIFKWNLNLRTPFTFLTFFFSKGVVSSSDISSVHDSSDCIKAAQKVQSKAIEFAEVALKNYNFYVFTSIAVAASSIALARKYFGLTPWNNDLEVLTWISWESIEECCSILWNDFIQDLQPDAMVKEDSKIEIVIDETETKTTSKKSCVENQSVEDKASLKLKKANPKKQKISKKQAPEDKTIKNVSKKENLINSLNGSESTNVSKSSTGVNGGNFEFFKEESVNNSKKNIR